MSGLALEEPVYRFDSNALFVRALPTCLLPWCVLIHLILHVIAGSSEIRVRDDQLEPGSPLVVAAANSSTASP